MHIEELSIQGAWIARSNVFSDERGFFREWFAAGEVEATTGRVFNVRQSNLSVSHKGVLRGIHYSLAQAGQSKWVTCASGSIWDVVVDLRATSPTFKQWVGITLSGKSGDAIFISEGLGHGFLSLEDDSIVSYLLTSPYSPSEEYEVNALDSELGISWPLISPILSEKDAAASTLGEMQSRGLLPR